MARIDALPSIEIIRGFRGILDFYVWRGLPCVRAWPKYRPAKQTAASLATALIFGAIVKAYNLLGPEALEAYRDDAQDQTRTARDLMVTGAYGNLHEASMSDFLTLLQQSRDFLSNLTALLQALHSVDTDEIVTRVEHSVLPQGASTFARQTSILTKVSEIADLQDALQSKALDRLLVRGMNQLHSYLLPLCDTLADTISGAGGTIDSRSPADGLVWHITHVVAYDVTSPITALTLALFIGGSWSTIVNDIRAIPAGEPLPSKTDFWLEHDDFAQPRFIGGLVGDNCVIELVGEVFTKET